MFSSLFGKSKPASAPDSMTTTATPAAAAAAIPSSLSQPSPSAAQQTTTTAATTAGAPSAVAALPPLHDSSMFSSRSLKQLGLFFAGATFLALSTTLTRRSVARKQVAAQLKFYSPSGVGTTTLGSSGAGGASAEAAAAQATREEAPHGSFMAAEALNLATLNVVSFFIMLTGGVSWALDVSSMDDLRMMARRYTRGPGLDGSTGGGGMSDEEAEREVEEWVAKVLKKSDGNLLGGSKKEGSERTKK